MTTPKTVMGSSVNQLYQGAVERCAGGVIIENMERSAPVENILAMQDWRSIGIVWKVCSLSLLYRGLQASVVLAHSHHHSEKAQIAATNRVSF